MSVSIKYFFFILFLPYLISCAYPMQQTSDSLKDSPGKNASSIYPKNKVFAKKNGTAAAKQKDVTAEDHVTPDNKTAESRADSRGQSILVTPQSSSPGSVGSGAEASGLSVSSPPQQIPLPPKALNGHDSDEMEMDETTEEALNLLKQAQIFRQKGDVDNALKALDQAYGLILEVNGDPNVARQKDDLRLMISKRILEIYTSKSSLTTGKRSEIPLIMNADVEREIRCFQTQERNFFIRSYQRSGAYLPVIKTRLKQAGLPEELAWLPLVESGFQYNVLSRARALGLWQFIPSTGYKYGLNRDLYIDERMDVEKSTEAAIAYMKELHALFGDWLTVLAAYNCGEGRIIKVISQQHINYLDHFWDLYKQLPYETARYVPRFLATLHIIKDPKKYGMDVGGDVDKPLPCEIVKTNKIMRLGDIASELGIPKDTLVCQNPELRHHMTPDRSYDLRIPLGMANQYALVSDKIEEAKAPIPEVDRRKGKKYVKHKVRKSDTIESIAKKYGISTKTILAYNKSSELKTGRIIKIPVGDSTSVRTVKKGKKGKEQETSGKEVVRYKVKKGDTLIQIAKRYNATPEEIKKMNNLQGNSLKYGQVIKIRSTEAGG
jgi:membrane-bound lytic murein transglycosylase D